MNVLDLDSSGTDGSQTVETQILLIQHVPSITVSVSVCGGELNVH